ncbi:MAG: hypothetical protein IKT67_12960 [Lachnospiraceae bacterium]|nr:hypothetical protein [Lachnospiraceae bacterium]
MKSKKRVEVPEKLWEKIKEEYISTDTSYRQLERRHGVSYAKIQAKARMGDWQGERERFKSNRTNKSLDLICEHQAKEISKALMVANKLLDKIERSVDAVEDGDTQSIKQLTGAVKDLKEIGVFRADMDRREQMARIAKLEKETAEEVKDTTIQIVIDDELKRFSK